MRDKYENSRVTIQQMAEGSSIELNRTSKGLYSWSIKIYGTDPVQILTDIQAINEKLVATYANQERSD